MVKKIIWSKNALDDRIQILEYWFERIGTKTYSNKLDQKIKYAVKLISKYPEAGRLLEGRSERFFVIEYYLIIYEVTENIDILHIWDGRRDPDDLKL